jgi:glycerophosphoryl diester phosphodiesterase
MLYTGKGVPVKTESKYNIRSINHRGYNSIAPENTLSAYKLSKQNGYYYVECDVSFTSDNVPVLLHDDTIDRTSNGSGSISSLSFETVRTYDFGSWKSSSYTGELIPSFEEFMLLCKNIGLHPYVEIKTSITDEQATLLVDIVKSAGMINYTTWISFDVDALLKIANIDKNGRFGYVVISISESIVNQALSIKGDDNSVFIDCRYSSVTSDGVTLCKNNNIELEVWSPNVKTDILALDSYITGVTTDTAFAEIILYDEHI